MTEHTGADGVEDPGGVRVGGAADGGAHRVVAGGGRGAHVDQHTGGPTGEVAGFLGGRPGGGDRVGQALDQGRFPAQDVAGVQDSDDNPFASPN